MLLFAFYILISFQYCEDRDGILAEVRSAEEQANIGRILNLNSRWIGLTDDGKFEFIDLLPLPLISDNPGKYNTVI